MGSRPYSREDEQPPSRRRASVSRRRGRVALGARPPARGLARDRRRQRLDRRFRPRRRRPRRDRRAGGAARLRPRGPRRSQAATADYVAFCDADASMDPADLVALAAPVMAGDADLVLGRRRPTTRGAWPVHARLANLALSHLMRRATRRRPARPRPDARRPTRALLDLDLRTAAAATRSRWCCAPAEAGWRIVEQDAPYSPRVGREQGDRHHPRHVRRDQGHVAACCGRSADDDPRGDRERDDPGQGQDAAAPPAEPRAGRRRGRRRHPGHPRRGPPAAGHSARVAVRRQPQARRLRRLRCDPSDRPATSTHASAPSSTRSTGRPY